MLTKPESGWTIFNLERNKSYRLSYLDDIAFEWLDQAIHGLETMRPFCVKGFLEPNRFLCAVSYWNCHIITFENSMISSIDVARKKPLKSVDFGGFCIKKFAFCICACCRFRELPKPAFSLVIAM